MMKTNYKTDFLGDPSCPVHGFNHDKGKPKFFGNDRVNGNTTYKHDYPPKEFSP